MWAVYVILSLSAVVAGGLLAFLAQSQLSDISQISNTASSIPLIGWLTGAAADYNYAELKQELEPYRLIGLGIAGFGLVWFLSVVLSKGKQKESQRAAARAKSSSKGEGVRVCLNCGFQNSDEIKFCGDCGAALP